MHVLDFPHSLTIEQGCRAPMYPALHPVLCCGTILALRGLSLLSYPELRAECGRNNLLSINVYKCNVLWRLQAMVKIDEHI